MKIYLPRSISLLINIPLFSLETDDLMVKTITTFTPTSTSSYNTNLSVTSSSVDPSADSMPPANTTPLLLPLLLTTLPPAATFLYQLKYYGEFDLWTLVQAADGSSD